MKFAHLADCHIGGWRDKRLRELNLRGFEKAAEICIERKVGFILIAGDLFDVAVPDMFLVEETARVLSKLKQEDIPVYIIPGSHDFSPSGKTIITILEKAGLLELIKKEELIVDRTGVKITGVGGKKGGLEIEEYKNLNYCEKDGFRVFMFHTLFNEFKPSKLKDVDFASAGILPKGFDYYAGGHPHLFLKSDYDCGVLCYPGPLFPNNFEELEELKAGGFCIVDDKLNVERIILNFVDVENYSFDVTGKSFLEMDSEIKNSIKEFNGKILLIRLIGILEEEIDFNKIFLRFNDAYSILRNISKLKRKEIGTFDVKGSINEIEDGIICEGIKGSLFPEKSFFNGLMDYLNDEKKEGERNVDFEDRIVKALVNFLNLENDNKKNTA